MAPELTHSYLLTIIARPERAMRGIDGNLWRRGSCHACEEKPTLQCGRAPRTRQCDPGYSWGWHWQVWRRIIETTLAGFTAQPEGVFLPAACLGSTGKQDNKDGASLLSCFTFLSTCSKDCGANAAFSNVRRVTEPTPSKMATETHGGFRIAVR